ncbi:hypothetical protein BDN72DRAFT_582032 [Pluteus cervinus]|uniref:Uncharacterized protein n=1 Tax=Pluteus cervinus TaxID=181527 RepID=A0ACD3AY16_9AGAR|nr:hypothetical protein BDN72DRAFT_582032 [Pluteus cervinus]
MATRTTRLYGLHYGPNAAAGNPPFDERSSLLPFEPFSHWHLKKREYLSYILVFLFVIMGYLLGTINSVDPEHRERIRREWQRELELHLADVNRFKAERENMTSTRQGWVIEQSGWEQKRRQWKGEEADIARRANEVRRKEKSWKDKEEHERRIRDSFRWTDLTPAAQCTRYGVREYTATFVNPGQYPLSPSELLTACSNTEAVIMGHTLPRPDYCEFTNEKYIAHWSVGDLPNCRTYFEGFRDVGCMAPGSSLRRYEAHLMTLRPEDDGKMMCDTTPARLKGKSFSGPDSCVDWGKWGWWGIWWLEDPECRNLQVEP